MKLVRIAPGKFLMGSPNAEPERTANEIQHEVQITRSFFLGVYTVTQAQYKKVMGTNPSFFSATGGGQSSVRGLDTSNFPVEKVSWNDADAFCKKLSALRAEKGARRKYRLPTSAEWEFACRAGAKTPFSWGKTITAAQANFSLSPLNRTCKVGSYKPNAWGLYDMHGNVWQFVSDRHDANYYRVSPRKDPPGPTVGTMRECRGGSCRQAAMHCRAAFRGVVFPTTTYDHVGFRVACDIGGGR
jgi:formylglycine-generating enzyme required for sulfatase activity